ncbi:regulator of chromosome condensation, putative [Plasmodium sp. DRC-Itaito]|nr:regulator of chromosome condensation, putative [Plasmodium sp. DRC-Itaito]
MMYNKIRYSNVSKIFLGVLGSYYFIKNNNNKKSIKKKKNDFSTSKKIYYLNYFNNIHFCENKNEKVYLFGDKRCLIKETNEDGECPFFERNKIKVKKISFGNCIASCITENDEVYIWGSYEKGIDEENKELIYIDPFKLNSTECIIDIQFSNKDIYLMTKKGELKIIRNYKKCLKDKEFIIENFYKGTYNFFFFKNEKIIKMSVNKYHLAFITNKGNVYCSGNNFYGQCGKEPSLKNNLNLNYNFEFANNINTYGTFNSVNNQDKGYIHDGDYYSPDYLPMIRDYEFNRLIENEKEENKNEYSISVYGINKNEKVKRIKNNILLNNNDEDIDNTFDEISSDNINMDVKKNGKVNTDPHPHTQNKVNINYLNNSLDSYDHFVYSPDDIINNHVDMNKVEFKEKTRIVDISCGLNHTLCLDDKNNVYSFGDDSKIQLGLGESRTNKNSLAGTKWKDQIKLGYTSATKNATNYSFYDRHIQSSPQKIMKKINDNEIINDIYKINAGSNFSMIFSNDKFGKQLFCFGDNIYFQCGRHLGKHQQTLSTVKLPNNKINDFTCGDTHCLLNLNNQVYGWGYNDNNQISPYKNKGIINIPVNILADLKKKKNHFDIKYINAKYNNSVIIISYA